MKTDEEAQESVYTPAWGSEPCPANPFDGRESVRGVRHVEELQEGYGMKHGDTVVLRSSDPFQPGFSSVTVGSIAEDGSYIRTIEGRVYMKDRVVRTLWPIERCLPF